MILALIKAQWISLLRDRMAMALTFLLPCIMFSVFAVIFGGSDSSTEVRKTTVIAVDLDQSDMSTRMIESLRAMKQIAIEPLPETSGAATDKVGSELQQTPADQRLAAARLVKTGRAAAAVIFPSGLEKSVGLFNAPDDRVAVEVIYDASNPIAQQMLTGVLQASAFTSVPEVLITEGLDQFRAFGGPFTPLQEAAVGTMKSFVNPPESADAGGEAGMKMSVSDGLVKIRSTSAADLFTAPTQRDGKITGQNMISYYAAAISVMFVMFSMSGAASGLLEHEEKGTLERLLSGGLTVFRLLIAHWLFYVMLGVAQIGLMLVFASAVFRLDLWHGPQLLGSAVMAIVSSMASAAFIMMIATLCKSRKQLEGLSSIIVLIMSAIGGSMMPRFIMPKFVVTMSSVAFNSWAMDGFLDVFWHHIPGDSVLAAIAGEVLVIAGMTALFLSVAFFSSRRWAVK
jgi:ABC-2 type transport system permease protein